jgi:hypothetical protein
MMKDEVQVGVGAKVGGKKGWCERSLGSNGEEVGFVSTLCFVWLVVEFNLSFWIGVTIALMSKNLGYEVDSE